jgi:hypothetical protein
MSPTPLLKTDTDPVSETPCWIPDDRSNRETKCFWVLHTNTRNLRIRLQQVFAFGGICRMSLIEWIQIVSSCSIVTCISYTFHLHIQPIHSLSVQVQLRQRWRKWLQVFKFFCYFIPHKPNIIQETWFSTTHVRFGVLTAVNMRNAVFWDIKPSSYFTVDILRLRYLAEPVNAM